MPTKTSRKFTFALIESLIPTIIAGAILGVLAALIIFRTIPKAEAKEEERNRVQCIQNLKLIKLVESAFAYNHGKTNGYPILPADIYGTNAYIIVAPVCPSDGSPYKINPIGTDPTCPNPGHAIPPKP